MLSASISIARQIWLTMAWWHRPAGELGNPSHVTVHLCVWNDVVDMIIPDSKVHGANMGPTWVLSAPDGPHVGPMNLAIRDDYHTPAITGLMAQQGITGLMAQQGITGLMAEQGFIIYFIINPLYMAICIRSSHYNGVNNTLDKAIQPSLIAMFMGPTWGPHGSCRPQMAPCWPHKPFHLWPSYRLNQWRLLSYCSVRQGVVIELL